MTPKFRTALGSVLIALLLAASSSVVGADAPHILSATGIGQEHFEQMATTSETAALFLLPGTSHVLNALGIGQEHFEAMSVDDASFVILAPATN